MDNLKNIKIFLDIMREFLDYLSVKYPEFKGDLFLTKTSMNLLANTNPRLVVEQFMSYINPYSKHIEDCNDTFFLNFDNLITNDTPRDNVMFAVRIKSIWINKGTSDIDKAKIWVYFKKFLKVGKRVINS